MINENDIETAIIDELEKCTALKGYTFTASLFAINPLVYDFGNAKGGAVLVSCTATDYISKLGRSFAGINWRVTIALGISSIKDNKLLWETKQALLKQIAFKKPLQEASRIVPISDYPIQPETSDGIFWVKLDFAIENYTGL